jgi:para-aminobenzoate synthetase component I
MHLRGKWGLAKWHHELYDALMHVLSIPYREPAAAFSVFADDKHGALLDRSSKLAAACISLIAAEPVAVVSATDKGGFVDGVFHAPDPFSTLDEVWQRHKAASRGLPPVFSGALIGYLGYELGGFLERLPLPKPGLLSVPMMSLGIYDTAAFFDHRRRRACVVSANKTKASYFAGRLAAAPVTLPSLGPKPAIPWQAEQSRVEMESNIRRILDYIRAGDIYQANYTQRFTAHRPAGLSDFDMYRRLRCISPAPYSTFLRCGEISIASASPERFLALNDAGVVTAQPIKGTRPRDDNRERDEALALELKQSEKDNAENLMIVDLMRNDLSRVCKIGSVRVPQLNRLQSFTSVHHLVSTVRGQLRDGVDPIDVLRATFPGGSVTGAPKIRAMEIIRKLEPSPRGAYCGALGWIGFDGRADLAMTIRTLTLTPKLIMAQAGGGIVADSDPAAEYDESMVKIAPLLRA